MIKLLDLLKEINEGAKVDFDEQNNLKDIQISYTHLNGEQLNTINGNRKTTNYNVYYSLESDPKSINIKQSQDALKYNSNKINKQELKTLIIKTLGFNLGKIDYIGYLESKGGLNNVLLDIIKEIYNIPSENIIEISKMEYNYIDDSVDWEKFKGESEGIKDAILNFLDKRSKTPGPYKIRKSGEIESKIIQRLHSKYNLGLNPNTFNHPLPPIYNILVKCLTQNKKLLIIDDNLHTGEDFRKIFKSIDILFNKLKDNINIINPQEQNAINRKKEIESLPHFKNNTLNDRLKQEYSEITKIYNNYIKKQDASVNIFKDPKTNIFGYVLYILKDSDLEN